MRHLAAAAVLFLACLSPDVALAQPDTDEEARAMFVAGRAAFDQGRYEDALERFTAAYELSGQALLLYNIGQCHDRLRNDDEALRYLRRYLDEAPTDAPQREQVSARVAALEAAVARREARAAEEAARAAQQGADPADVPADASVEEPAEVAPAESGRSVVPFIAMGAGAAAIGVGIGLMVSGASTRSDVESAPAGSRFADYDVTSADRRWKTGQVLLGVGAAAAAAGVALVFVLDGDGDDTDSANADDTEVVVGINPTGVMIRGTF